MNKNFVPVITHIAALLLGMGLSYLLGGKPDPAHTNAETKAIAREATTAALSVAQTSASAALSTASPEVQEIAGPAIDVAVEEAASRAGEVIDRAVDKALPVKGRFKFAVGDWKHTSPAAGSKYTKGTLKIEADRPAKDGIKSTPYNLTFYLVDDAKHIFEGGCGFYDDSTAFCKTDKGNPKDVTTNRDIDLSLQKVGNVLVLDIPALGMSEHFVQ